MPVKYLMDPEKEKLLLFLTTVLAAKANPENPPLQKEQTVSEENPPPQKEQTVSEENPPPQEEQTVSKRLIRKRPIRIEPTDNDSDDPTYEPPQKTPGRPRRYLELGEYPDIKEQITKIEHFCCDPMNLLRQGDAIKTETWRKTKIHILMFFTYLVEMELEPHLEQLEDRNVVQGFLQWIQKERKLQPGTISTYIDHLLTGLRYIYATEGKDYKQESMTRWLSRRRDEFHKDTTASTSHHSWQSLQKNKQWISW